MKTIVARLPSPKGHWVGDGFPARSLLSYDRHGHHISPFLLLDFIGPYRFEPTAQRRGVGEHPHRGFETVSIVYDGEVSHRDSAGNSGTIRPGDVQWMTAAGGVLHDEFHSDAFARRGGDFLGVQLWVNLPAAHKLSSPSYQALTADQIPVVALPDDAGAVRVIAGRFAGTTGPARTFTPVNLWDVRLAAGAAADLSLPEGHMAALIVIDGSISAAGSGPLGQADLLLFSTTGASITVKGLEDAKLLVLTGEPINEPIAGYGPFVMNSENEIRSAIADFNSGRFGSLGSH